LYVLFFNVIILVYLSFHLATIGDCWDVIAKFLLLALLLLDVVDDDDVTVLAAGGSFRCCKEGVIDGSF
jgi:hypothetical protein